MPDALNDPGAAGHRPADTPAAPPPVAGSSDAARDGRAPRRPSWLRAALWSLVVLVAGAALGGAGYRLERAALQTPAVERAGDGWVLTARGHRELSGIGLSGTHLIWQDGASIEYLDLERGKVLLLGPGPGMRTTWDPAMGERYAIWFEAERQASIAAQAVVYDTHTGRRWNRADVGSVSSYPAISGERAVWSAALDIGAPAVWGLWIAGGESPHRIAPGYGAPVVSGSLVVWARSWTGPFTAKEIETNVSWQVADGLSTGKLTGLALSGRTLVWGQSSEAEGSGVVAACGVDGGEPRAVASGVTGLAGPAYDGRTVVWGERTAGGGRVMARRLGAGDAFVVAETAAAVTEVAVSGGRVAWIERGDGAVWSILVRSLPR